MKRALTIMGLAVAILAAAAAVTRPELVLKGDGNPAPCSPHPCKPNGK